MRKPYRSTGREAGGFIALPWTVLDNEAYRGLSHPARSLLLEIARQYSGDNNGRLLTSKNYLAKRGWRSSDVITRAKKELLERGFIHETVMGHRPNRASWYAITWQTLDVHKDFDFGTAATFKRAAYRDPLSLVPVKKSMPSGAGTGPRPKPDEIKPLDRLAA